MSLFSWIKKTISKVFSEESTFTLNEDQEEEFRSRTRWVILRDYGFEIVDEKHTLYQKTWDSFSDSFFKTSHIVLIDKNKEEFAIPNYYSGWYEFIQNIPNTYPSYDFEAVRELMNSLTGCPVCGLMAVQRDLCLNCARSYNDLDHFSVSTNTYIKQEQLIYFEPENDQEYTNEIKEKGGFKRNTSWVNYIPEGFYENSKNQVLALTQNGKFLVENDWEQKDTKTFVKADIKICLHSSNDFSVHHLKSDDKLFDFYANNYNDLFYLLQNIEEHIGNEK